MIIFIDGEEIKVNSLTVALDDKAFLRITQSNENTLKVNTETLKADTISMTENHVTMRLTRKQ